jgi:ribosomal protein L31
MKKGIHPQMHLDAVTTCVSCNAVYKIPSTVKTQQVEVCSNCHPVYTGEYRGIIASLVLVIFCGLYLSPGIFFNDQATSLVNVLVIQSRNPVLFGYTDQYFENVVREYQKKVAEGLLMHPDTDIVVLPENTYFLKGIMERESLSVEEAVTEVLGTKKERLLIYGDYDTENRKTISVIAKNDGSTPLVLEKSLLMPLGEYQPYVIGWGARLLGKGAWFREVLEYRSSFAASTGQKTVATPWGKVAVAACSEILSADVYRSIAKENPALIVHEQRLAHFHGHLSVFKEFLAASQIKAAMLHTPILGSVDIWFKSKLKTGSDIGFGWSHEEPITDMMKNFVSSYSDLPRAVHQFQNKFRNETRAKSGLMRCREFVMKDMYSYSRNEEEHMKFYDAATEAYLRVYRTLGLGNITFVTSASGGLFTDKFSHEFQTLCDTGEDTVYVHKDGKTALVGRFP